MAKRKQTRSGTPSKRTQAQLARDMRAFMDDIPRPSPQQTLPGLTKDEAAQLADPLHGIDALEQLARALREVGIDPTKAAQLDSFLLDQWHMVATARTEHSELVALAVEHTQEARAQAQTRPRTMREVQQEAKALADRVLATMYLRRGMRPPHGIEDDRRPLLMDSEIIGLVRPGDDARSALVTLKLPQVVIDRLRDAVQALAPHRTMGGIAALGISLVLDALEAEHLKQTGKRFPRKAGQVLEGGRPSRTRATTAQAAPPGPRPKKQARSGAKHP